MVSRPPAIAIHSEVAAALREKRPVVALESAVITHGLPREPLPSPRPNGVTGWDARGPTNLELAQAMERTVRANGAVPATVAVMDGTLHVGLDDAALARLAADGAAMKASARDLAGAMLSGRSAGLTVAGTLDACRLASIRFFATGGIGGAHRGWAQSADVSADLRALSLADVCVVCAGAKSILDLRATLEMLDTLGVPVVGFGTDCFPRFVSPPDSALPLPCRLDDPAAIARLCERRWTSLGQRGGVLVVQPVPADAGIGAEEMELATHEAERRADAARIRGAELTPFLLHEIAAITGGRSLVANISLLLENARLAARIAQGP